ncbi:MAG TPA: single-stranded DNA-binding protein [Planctomycetaceae bacterium]|nr:single-stranded DNA-binding protein [Planctomycetaceae bacterium]HRF02576.1 single-stranded DNA-binding protein [Pirellulaceae bacterium]
MASFNKVVLVGNLTRDVEVRFTPSQMPVTDIGLAVNDRVKRNNEWVDEATFVDVTLFGRNAEIAGQYLSKGSQVLIEGRLKLDQWEQDGQKRSKLKVIGENMRMLGSRREGGGSGGSGGPSQRPSRATSPSRQQDAGNRGYDDYSGGFGGDSGEEDVPF